MNLTPTSLAAGVEKSKEDGPPTQVVKTEENQELPKVFPLLSLELLLFQPV